MKNSEIWKLINFLLCLLCEIFRSQESLVVPTQQMIISKKSEKNKVSHNNTGAVNTRKHGFVLKVMNLNGKLIE